MKNLKKETLESEEMITATRDARCKLGQRLHHSDEPTYDFSIFQRFLRNNISYRSLQITLGIKPHKSNSTTIFVNISNIIKDY